MSLLEEKLEMPNSMDDIDELILNIDDGNDREIETVTSSVSISHGKCVSEELLQTDPNIGLTNSEVIRRRKIYGINELSEKKERRFLKFLLYFVGPVQYVMFFAVILSAALFKWIEFAVILSLLVLNAVLGWMQEYQAGKVVENLRKLVACKTNVIRDGITKEIPTIDVVPGDLIPLDEGSICPADGRIINDAFLQVDQSPLTGESLPAEKRKNDIVYSSSVIKRGDGILIVTSIADDTFVGETASLVSTTNTVGHFQKVLNEIATALLVLVVIFLTIIWVVGFFRGYGMRELLIFTLNITVIGVPVGLPAVVTTTLVVGTAQLARKNVIVQRLAAIESLAGVDILCSDKTGTLTQNKLTMGSPFVVKNVTIEELLLTSVLASSRKQRGLDAIDKTVILSLKKYPQVKEIVKRFSTLEFYPFDPVGKKVKSIVRDSNDNILICVKGAPAAVLHYVQEEEEQSGRTLPLEIIEEYNKKVDEFALKGLRSLGVAQKRNEEPWKILGIIQLFDPPRHDTLETIEEAKKLGLKIKMLTGDAVGIAKETCKQLRLGTNVYNIKKLIMPDLNGNLQTGKERNALVEGADGFAEVFPHHKHMVVDILQQRGHLVAMTGDGVNDAPCLKIADAGIAVEGATEAARAAADIVFLNSGLSTIIDALKTSRMIFHRMRAYVVYRIALSIHLEIFVTTMVIALGYTINSELVVFLAIFADIATLAIAYDNATFSMRPTKWNLLNLWATSLLQGIFLALGTWVILGTMLVGNQRGIISSYGNIQSILFLEIALTQNWLILITRCNGPFWNSYPSWQLFGAVLAVDIVATIFTFFGLFAEGVRTDIITIIRIWVFSIGIFVGLALIHQMFNESDIFEAIYRKFSRWFRDGERYDEFDVEDQRYHLEKVALLHEKNGKNGNGNGNGHNHLKKHH